jgi:protein SCO1/2
VAALAVVALATPRAWADEPAPAPWQRTTARYRIPDVTFVRSDGARVSWRRELDDEKPILLNFIFTTCAAICPVMSQTFAQIQSRLGEQRSQVHMMSVSIDPEEDTPARLRDYAQKLHAGAQWSFYTGSLAASIAAQQAFDVYRGDKMNHQPVTFLRIAPNQPWVRLAGFASADEVIAEYRRLLADR